MKKPTVIQAKKYLERNKDLVKEYEQYKRKQPSQFSKLSRKDFLIMMRYHEVRTYQLRKEAVKKGLLR